MGNETTFFTILTHNSHYVKNYFLPFFWFLFTTMSDFFGVANFSHFVKNIFNKEYPVANSMIVFWKKKNFAQKSKPKNSQENRQKLAYKYERVLKILYFLLLNIANLAICTYGLSPLERHYKFLF